MTSEERALNLMEWLNTDDEEYIATLDTIKDMFDQHAAEQRETNIKALRNVCQHFMGHNFNTGSLALLEDAMLNAVEET